MKYNTEMGFDLQDFYFLKQSVDNKLDAITSKFNSIRAYVVTADGRQDVTTISINPVRNTIMMRDSNGRASVQVPISSKDVANKEYVDDAVKKVEEELPEKSTGNSVILQPNVACLIDVITSGTPATKTYSFTVSNGATIERQSTAYPASAEPVSRFSIVWDGLHGQIDWNGCYWLIERNEQPIDTTLTFPAEYGYKITLNYF